MIRKEREYLIYILIAIVSICLVGVFSVSISVLYSDCYIEGGNQFSLTSMVIAKGWAEGMVPYRDLFGTDGPLFYLVEMIAWFLAGKTGLMVLQMAANIISCIMFYSLARRYVGIVFSLGTAILGNYVILACGGLDNSAQLIVLALSLSLLCWYLKKERAPVFAEYITLGIVFAAGILIQIKSVFLIFAVVIAVLIKYKDAESFGKKIVGLLAGVLLMFLPFAVYFLMNHAFAEFIDGAIIYNLKSLGLGFGTLNEIVRKGIKCIPVFIVLAMEILFRRKMDENEPVWIIGALLSILFLASGSGWWIYYVMLSPLVIYSTVLIKCLEGKKGLLTGGMLICSILIIFAIPFKTRTLEWKAEIADEGYKSLNQQVTQWVHEGMKEDEKALAVDLPASYYLIAEQMPTFRLFDHQTLLTSVDAKYSEELLDYIDTDDVDWLLVKSAGLMNQWYGNYGIQGFIDLYSVTGVYHLDVEGAHNHVH